MTIQQPDRRRVSRFTASFDSECETCDDEILEGDEAGFLPGEVKASCYGCVDEYEEAGS